VTTKNVLYGREFVDAVNTSDLFQSMVHIDCWFCLPARPRETARVQPERFNRIRNRFLPFFVRINPRRVTVDEILGFVRDGFRTRSWPAALLYRLIERFFSFEHVGFIRVSRFVNGDGSSSEIYSERRRVGAN